MRQAVGSAGSEVASCPRGRGSRGRAGFPRSSLPARDRVPWRWTRLCDLPQGARNLGLSRREAFCLLVRHFHGVEQRDVLDSSTLTPCRARARPYPHPLQHLSHAGILLGVDEAVHGRWPNHEQNLAQRVPVGLVLVTEPGREGQPGFAWPSAARRRLQSERHTPWRLQVAPVARRRIDVLALHLSSVRPGTSSAWPDRPATSIEWAGAARLSVGDGMEPRTAGSGVHRAAMGRRRASALLNGAIR